LATLARELQDSIRSDDIFARFDGKGFALLLRHVDQIEAMRIAQSLREKIQRLSIPYTGPKNRAEIALFFSISQFDGLSTMVHTPATT
jgi:diguanylate cyclase (GGDEF)-like protein